MQDIRMSARSTWTVAVLILAIVTALAVGFGFGSRYADTNSSCRDAVEQIVGPAENYNSAETNARIAECVN